MSSAWAARGRQVLGLVVAQGRADGQIPSGTSRTNVAWIGGDLAQQAFLDAKRSGVSASAGHA
jgi:hypothetical protein